jgi:hypothetical protein
LYHNCYIRKSVAFVLEGKEGKMNKYFGMLSMLVLVAMMVGCSTLRIAHAAPKGPGDVNGDGKVDIKDIVLAAASYGSVQGGPKWNPDADLNGDGRIDLFDLVIIIRYYGSIYA